MVRRDLCVLMRKEETFWRQRSRNSWLQGGDSNTQFFHECVSQRKRTNTVYRLRDSNNTWQTDRGIMEVIAVGIPTIFTSSNPTNIDAVTRLVDEVVKPEKNSTLM